MNRHRYLATVGCIAAITLCGQARAQSSQADETSAARPADITVTAQRRSESLQKVPLSVQAFTGDTLASHQITRFEDLNKLAPTLSFDIRTNLANASVRLRGVGTQVFGVGVEPSVATVIDGIVMSRGAAALADLYDVARVEVLNGPQSTLFGKNASAGIVSITTSAPNTQRLETDASVTLAEGAEVRSEGEISGPVSDHLALRLAGYQHYYHGNVTNLDTGHTLNGYDNFGFRGKALLHDVGPLSATLSLDYLQQTTTCCVRVLDNAGSATYNPATIGSTAAPGTAGQLAGVAYGRYGKTVNIDHEPYTNTQSYGGALQVDYDLGHDYTLTSLTGARHFSMRNNRDNDETPLPFSQAAITNEDSDWVTQEIRITSPKGKPVDYVAGVYFYDALTHGLDHEVHTLADGSFEDRDIPTRVHSTNAALFGQANWHLTDRLTVIAGMRGIYDRIALATRNDGYTANAAGARTSSGSVEVYNHSNNTALAGKAGLQYEATRDVNLYATWSRGFKGAAFDSAPANINVLVAPERADAWEAGLRSSFLDHRLKFNLTLFRTDISNLQLTLRDLTADVSRLGSVAGARSQGIELDTAITPLTGLTFTLAGTRLDASYTSFANSPCFLGQTTAQGCLNNVQNLTDRQMVDAPKWKGVFSARYEQPIADLKGFVEYDARVQTASYLLTDDNPSAVQGAYGVQDIAIGIERGHRWNASIFVKNLLNQHYVTGYGVNGATAGGILLHTVPRDFDRYVGVAVSFHG